jgi:hypothetical protein
MSKKDENYKLLKINILNQILGMKYYLFHPEEYLAPIKEVIEALWFLYDYYFQLRKRTKTSHLHESKTSKKITEWF